MYVYYINYQNMCNITRLAMYVRIFGNIYLLADSPYNCSDHHATITDIGWTVFCPPIEEIILQSLSIINDNLPVGVLSPSDEIGRVTI